MAFSGLIDGPAEAPLRLLLAHGAGAPMDSPFMAAMATGLAARGWQVLRFEFPYMAKRRLSGRGSAPDRLPKLQEAFRALVQALDDITLDPAAPAPSHIPGLSLRTLRALHLRYSVR